MAPVRCNLLIASINLTYDHEVEQANTQTACDAYYIPKKRVYRLWFLLTSGIDCLEQFTIFGLSYRTFFFSLFPIPSARALFTVHRKEKLILLNLFLFARCNDGTLQFFFRSFFFLLPIHINKNVCVCVFVCTANTYHFDQSKIIKFKS